MQLNGIIPPVPTPFDAHGNLDTNGFAMLIAHLLPQVDGLLVLGSNGEVQYLNDDERREVVAAGVAAARASDASKPLLVGVTAEATRQAVAQVEHAATAGANAALVLPPHYYRASMTKEVLVAHYRALASVGLPLLVYNIPQNTSISFAPALLGELAAIPGIIGLKDSSGDVLTLSETLRFTPRAFTVLSGSAPTLLPALSLGARGGILAAANVLPGHYRRLLAAFRAGNIKAARFVQRQTDPIAWAVTRDHGIAGLKALLRLQQLPAGYPRAPLGDVSGAVLEHLAVVLATATNQASSEASTQ
jgi:4-hydroxy-2-oxoglutarate aldolase